MARDDGRVYFTPSEQVRLYLLEIQRMGIYGRARGDVINHILGEKIERLLESGLLKRLSQREEPKPLGER